MIEITDKKKIRILLVDDEPTIRDMISQYLQQYYDTVSAPDGSTALEILAKEKYDVVITDIDMPEMQGFELMEIIRKKYPEIKTILITSLSIEEQIKLALKHGVGNILAKTIPFNWEELLSTIDRLMKGVVFGLERYLLPGTEIFTWYTHSSREISTVRDGILEQLGLEIEFDETRFMLTKLVLDESLTNAVYHPGGYPRGKDIILNPDEVVEVRFGRDEEKIGFSITDNRGRLTQKTVLESLDRCINPTEDSLYRENGRGLFIMRSMVDRLIINVKENVKTEIILLLYTNRVEFGYKPLIINEL